MSVVPFPHHIYPQGPGPWAEWELRSNSASSRSPLTGATKTKSRPGSRWAVTLRYNNLNAASAAVMRGLIAALDGQANRCYIYDPLHTQRGSFAAAELLADPELDTVGAWTAANGSIQTRDRVMRLTTQNVAANVQFYENNVDTLVQYAPYAMRSIIHEGRGSSGLSIGPALSGLTLNTRSSYGTQRTLKTVKITERESSAATDAFPAVVSSTTGFLVGDYIDVSFASLVRCFLVDNAPNLLTYSEDWSNDWSLSRVTIDTDSTVAPDGVSDADTIQEDGTASNTHFVNHSNVTVSATTGRDFFFSVFVQAENRDWVRVMMQEDISGHDAYCYFDVTNGVKGTEAVSGANWSNLRTFMQDAGNGWYRCGIVATKVSASTTIDCLIHVADADDSVSFNGASQDSLYVWGAQFLASEHPVHYRATTASALSSGVAQSGSVLRVKGLPISTNGLLLPGDWVQVRTDETYKSELKRVTAPLDSDAMGLGYLKFEPQMLNAPDDDAPVMATKPLGRFMLDGSSARWSENAEGYTDLEVTLVEDIVA